MSKRKRINTVATKVAPQANLYPKTRYGKTKPRFSYLADTAKTQTTYTREDQMGIARSLFATCPDLGGAILSKAEWSVGPSSYQPIYTGTDSVWGDKAEEWLVNEFYPVCSVHGPNYPFTKILELSSIALDVDGDTGMFLTYTRDGLPKVGLLASHRIGQRIYTPDNLVTTGRYKGYRIFDGIIVNKVGYPIAARILADKEEDDIDIPFGAFSLLFDAEWCDQYRGISRIARSRYDWEDQDDINEFIKRNVKLASSIGLKYKSADGTAQSTGFNTAGIDEDGTTVIQTGVDVTAINGGEIYFMNSLNGEDIETLKNENPSANTEAFMERIQARALYSIGWPSEIVSGAHKIGGASVRLIQDLVRKTITKRQNVLERRARTIVLYALAVAMDIGVLPKTKDFTNWNFTKGNLLTVDGGNEAKSDIENYKLGISTLSDLISKQGKDWYQVRNQTQKEVEDLIDRAQQISTSKNVPFAVAIELLRQASPNPTSLSLVGVTPDSE